MRCHNTALVVLVLLVAVSAALPAQPNCSIQTLAGTWVASSQGTVFAAIPGSSTPVPLAGAAIGVLSIGYDGHVTGLLYGAIGGRVGTIPFDGVITVHPDCTGAVSAAAPGWRLTEDIVILDHGGEVWTIAMEGIQGQPAAWGCKWRRIGHVPLPMSEAVASCSADMLSGTWVGVYNGVLLVPGEVAPDPLTVLAKWVADSKGQLRGSFTSSTAGQMTTDRYVGSVVEVNPDCTGTLRWSLLGAGGAILPGERIEKFVILNEGKEIWSVPLQGVAGMPISLGRHRQVFPVALK